MAGPTVSDMLLEILAEVGVRHIFGIPGDAINALLDALRRQDVIEFVQVRHEEAGALAASAQAKLTGRLGVCVGTAGPGAVHLLNGLYDAKLDHAPVLAITGQVDTSLLGTHYHQEIDLYTLFKDVAAFNETIVNPAQLPDAVINACQTALSQRTVAHLSLPVDIASSAVPEPERRHAVFGNRALSAPCQSDLDAAVELLDDASKVAILAGTGARAGVAELIDLAERLGAPIIKTLRAKDLLPDDHPLCVGGLGLLGTRAAVKAVDGCDVLLMVGTDFPYRDFYPENAKAIQIELDPQRIGRRYPVDVGLVGHAHLALRALRDAVAIKPDRSYLESIQGEMVTWRRHMRRSETSDNVPIKPQRVAALVGAMAPDDAIFVCDTGTVTVWGARHLAIRGQQRFTLSSSLASMAYALPGAIGAQLAYPDRQVVALAGDGGFAMLMADFLTAVKYGLPITVVIFNNHKLGLITMEQESQGYPDYQTALHNPDFAEFARLCGGDGVRVNEPADLQPALERALGSDLPFIVDVEVNPAEITMPPKILPRFALGYAMSKMKEVMGQGDAEAGIKPLTDPLS